MPVKLVAGVDEVGRGALFGPVVAAVVAVPLSTISKLRQLGVRDSKRLSKQQRWQLVPQIQTLASGWKISCVSAAEIDRLNILQASLQAMKQAVAGLPQQPDICFVDGKQTLPGLTIPQLALVKGDRRSPAIAAASILAKVWRDDLISCLAEKYSGYGLSSHKGYGTPRHRSVLEHYGPSPQHRLSFAPCRSRL
ncbi:MAG: ribonuclease HII [Cyanophyceae cyanobacterium]